MLFCNFLSVCLQVTYHHWILFRFQNRNSDSNLGWGGCFLLLLGEIDCLVHRYGLYTIGKEKKKRV